MSRDDAVVLDLLLAARRALDGVKGMDFELFSEDWKSQSIVLHQLMVLGEAVKRLSEDFRQKYNQIPWRQVAGMRDMLIHGYDTVDLNTVWEVTRKELPSLIQFLETIAPSRGEQD